METYVLKGMVQNVKSLNALCHNVKFTIHTDHIYDAHLHCIMYIHCTLWSVYSLHNMSRQI